MRRAFLPVVYVVAILAAPAGAGAQTFETVGIRAQGMGGAFVAIADDASATWWNPAGLASGAYLNALLETGRGLDPSRPGASGIALALPSMGLSYYRLQISEITPPAASTAGDGASRQDQGILSDFGVTLGQSIGDYLVVASTLKLLRAADSSRGDLDIGAMVRLGRVRAGLAVKNVTAPVLGVGAGRLELPRQVRAGVAVGDTAGRVIVGFDGDLTTTTTAGQGGVGTEVRHLAVGGEVWTPTRRIGVRSGLSVNTVGNRRASGSGGLSFAVRRGAYVEGQITGGADPTKEGWGFDLRVTF
jgi:hypothetical protein